MGPISTVFLDRDGVINRLRSEGVTSWDQFDFLPRALEALHMLSAAGLRTVVVTNQRAVARGALSLSALETIHANMLAEMAAAGAAVAAVYYCPHDEGRCACRKPRVGMFLRAQHDCPAIDFRRSVVIGDSLTDMEAGRTLGCELILVTETGCPDRDGEVPGAVQAAGIHLDGSARTLYDAVAHYLLPGRLSGGEEVLADKHGRSRRRRTGSP